MNPRIHHPLWYRLIECISEKEETDAKDVTLIPPFAKFTTGEITIQCAENRWDIGTNDEKLRERILQIACKVFDKLYETPVNAIGFNTITDVQTLSPSVSRALGKIGVDTGLSFEANDLPESTFAFVKKIPFQTVIASVTASGGGENLVRVSYNTHRDFKPVKEYRNLTPELTEHFDPHYREAISFAEKVSKRLSEHEPAKN